MTVGLKNPLVTMEQYRNTLARITELSGFRNVDAFWLNPENMKPEDKAQIEQAMAEHAAKGQEQPPMGPDPQVEMAKVQAMTQKAQMDDAREREFKAADLQIESQKIQADYEAKLAVAQIQSNTTLEKVKIDADVKQFSKQLESQTKILVEHIKPRGGSDNGMSNGVQ